MPVDISFQDEEYQPSTSEDEYDDNEKRLLSKFRNRKQQDSESEVEVLGVGSENDFDDESDDNHSDIALSDVEGQESNDDLPDLRAWGKEKKKYYGADYIDPDYGGFQGKDAEAAEIEEEEARNLQNQLVEQLDDNDFSLDIIFKQNKVEIKEQDEELVKTDLSQLTNKQKIQILQKESPEFFGLIEDFKAKMLIAKDFLHPIMQKVKSGKVQKCNAVEFIQTQYHLILNYATNIYMYLILKNNKELSNHPIIKKLYQYRQLLSQLDKVFEDIIKPQIVLLLDDNVTEKSVEKPQKVKKILNILSKKVEKVNKIKSDEFNVQPMKKIKLDKDVNEKRYGDLDNLNEEADNMVSVSDQQVESDKEMHKNEDESGDISKRAITYQIAKNKGLTPHRKKEFRNPRVKHKIKYRKALIRRKGAVREPRKELTRYSGEISGIKASLSKSIKIKS